MDDRVNVKVDFPRKMEVDSPKIRSIERSTTAIVDVLHENMKKIVEPLQELKFIRTTLAVFREDMVERVRELFTGSVAVQMKAREADIIVNKNKIKFIASHIQKKHAQYQEIVKRIKSRYGRYSKQLVKEHSDFICQLDGHVFELTDSIYPNEIQKKFSFVSVEFWNQIAKNLAETVLTRSQSLNSASTKAETHIDHFLEQRNQCYLSMDSLFSNAMKEGEYNIPFYYAVIVNEETGEVETQIVFSEEFEKQGIKLETGVRGLLESQARLSLQTAPSDVLGGDDTGQIRHNCLNDQNMSEEEADALFEDCQFVVHG
ncbi:hypothetical protein KAR48_18165 [bacterium]|nr:hypothetical protein [bacterium]